MTATGKVLVTGATGTTGSMLVPALRSAGVNVRAFVRDEAVAQPLADVGAEIAVGDLSKPETIKPALEGIDRVYLLTWNGRTQAEHALNVIEAAGEASEPHIVRHSMWGSENSRIVQQGTRVEEELRSSGLPWTILRPTFFMQNLMMAAQTIAADGVMYWSLEDAEMAMVDVRDVVDSAVAVLTEDAHVGKSYRLTGPEAITFHDVADTLTEALGKEVEYVTVSDDVAKDSMQQMGMSAWRAAGYVELFEGFRAGFADEPSEDVAELKGERARSIEVFVRDFAEMFEVEPA